jgi:hypothetical protein
MMWLYAAAAALCVSAALVMIHAVYRAARRRQAVVRAYADALFPPHGPVPISGGDAGAVRYMERYIDRSEPRGRRLVKLLIIVSELAPIAFGPRRTSFTRLRASEQQIFLARAMTSRVYLLRMIFITMRVLLTMAYFANETVRFHLGIGDDPEPFAEPTPAPKISGQRLRKVPLPAPAAAKRA